MTAKTIRVRALTAGYCGSLRQPGAIFDIPAGTPLGSWMVPVDGTAGTGPAAVQQEAAPSRRPRRPRCPPGGRRGRRRGGKGVQTNGMANGKGNDHGAV